MAKNKGRIVGITVEIGGDVTGLNKALGSVNAEIRDTQSQLRDVERLLKLDPKNTELLAQKQRLLGQEIEQVSGKLDTLRKAEKQVQEQFKKGDISQEQYEGLQREIIATENQLQKLEDAAKEANDAVGDIGKGADSGSSLDFSDVLGADAIVEGVSQVVDAVDELRDEVAEYQRIMASLEVSSQKAGYSADETSASYEKLYGVLGDEQTAATTLSNLQALSMSQEDLTRAIDGAVGAWATYGDSIPIDGLAEAINETIRTGTVTGTFADVLNWGAKEGETYGVMLRENTEANQEWNDAVADAESAEDYFNLALQNASSEAERQNLVMQALADQGLMAAGQAWQENNQDIVQANQAQADFMENAAQLSERLAPVFTAVQDGVNKLFEAFLNLTAGIDFNAMADMISSAFQFFIDNAGTILAILASVAGGIAALKLVEFASNIIDVATKVTTLADTFPALSTAISALSNPVFLIGTAVTALVVLIATKGDEIQSILQKVDNFLQNVFAADFTRIFGPVLGNALNAFFANLKNIWDSIKQIFDGIIDFIRGVFTGDWDRAWRGVVEVFSGIFDGLVAAINAPLNGVISAVNSAVGLINGLISGINSIRITNPFTGQSFGFNIDRLGTLPYLAKGGILSRGSAIVGEAGPELLTMDSGRAVVQPLTGGTTNTTNTNLGGVRINVYGAPGQDVRELADIVMDEIQASYGRKAAVYGGS